MRWVIVVCAWVAGAYGAGLWIDTATFRGREGTEVEVALKLSADSLGVRATEQGDRAEVSFCVTVHDTAGVALLSDRWERLLPPPPDSAGHEVYVLDSSSLELPPGTYVLQATALDRARGRTYSGSRRITVPAYAAPGLMLSDMLLSGSMPQAGEGQFVRAGLRMIPSPDRTFGRSGTMLYVYQEIYNLAPRSAVADSFGLSYRLLDAHGQEVRVFPTGGRRQEGDAAVKVSGLSIAGLAPGRYTLEACVEDQLTGLRTSVRRDIQIVVPRWGQEDELTEEEIAKSRDLLTYLATPKELALFESLDEAGKLTFIRRFWLQRDPDPHPGNPYLREMLRRYDYANLHYGGHSPGWRSDRGRVYIVYGPPKEVERHTADPATRDYEVWTYAMEGQAVFFFVDERGYGDFRLVHSTVRGEISNPAWEILLRPVDSH